MRTYKKLGPAMESSAHDKSNYFNQIQDFICLGREKLARKGPIYNARRAFLVPAGHCQKNRH